MSAIFSSSHNTLSLRVVSIFFTLSFAPLTIADSEDSADYFALSLESLANIKVVTSSRREQSVSESYANIQVITKEMISSRGYRNIIEMLEDLPGFDFSMYEDGGGEYSGHFLNRGIGGDNGNTRLLVMIDGLVQNHISYNWSQGLTDEQILADIERIEVVQGPGSSLYGANAVSGIVHIITKKNYQGSHLKLRLGENNTRQLEAVFGKKFGDVNLQLSLKTMNSDGDSGKGRYDPGNYFKDNVYPQILLADYDANNNFVTNTAHPMSGMLIPDGYNNAKENFSVRFKVESDTTQAGIQYWKRRNGLSNYVVAYEYAATEEDFISHHSGLTIFMKNQSQLIPQRLTWKTDLWFRLDKQEADTGFEYLYRFYDLKKSYHSASSQIGLENQFDFNLENNKTLTLGARLLGNRQTDQVISLGAIQRGNESTTTSSWDIAVNAGGLNQPKINEVFDETEAAIYAILDGEINPELSYSIGTRYSNGSDYGATHTPRAGLIYNPENSWLFKVLYGSAFRQPSLFELNDEFRGNENLGPEKVKTLEFETVKKINSNSQVKVNLFYSTLEDSIGLIEDNSRAGGERYDNINSLKVRGITARFDIQVERNLSIYTNYHFQQGLENNQGWGKVSHTAEHKFNLGGDWQPLDELFNINFRVNYVGKRAVPATNRYFDGSAPSYFKADVVLTWRQLWGFKNLTGQVGVNNLFDESYYGVGRQAGSSLKSEYHPLNNPDPLGFIPPYHPQPGRMLNASLMLDL
ncbi:TonB-dependent receptor plug domain-containing protein [Aliikangiella sp. IMCC44632]